MQLYIIRHCESTNNALWKQTGSSNGRHQDPPLTDIGYQQAQELANYLAQKRGGVVLQKHDIHNRLGYDFTHLYCSLMERAVQTGSYIAKALNLPLVAWEPIHERGGIYLHNPETDELDMLPGANRAFLETAYPHLVLLDSLNEHGWWNQPYEDSAAARIRAQQVIDELWTRHGNSEDRVWRLFPMVAFFNRYFLYHYTLSPPNLDTDRELWIQMNNGSISRFDFYNQSIVVSYLNRINFMPAEMIT